MFKTKRGGVLTVGAGGPLPPRRAVALETRRDLVARAAVGTRVGHTGVLSCRTHTYTCRYTNTSLYKRAGQNLGKVQKGSKWKRTFKPTWSDN